MKVKKTTKKHAWKEKVNVYSVVGKELRIREVASLLEKKEGIPAIRTIDLLQSLGALFTEELLKGNKIVIDDFCILRPSVTDDKEGYPVVSSILFKPSLSLSKAMKETKVKI